MSDKHSPKDERPEGEDFAARMARAEFGRHYVDPRRIEPALRGGEMVLRDKARRREPRR